MFFFFIKNELVFFAAHHYTCMCAFVCTQDNGDCVNRAVSVPQFSPEATPLRGECQLVKKKIYIYVYLFIYLFIYIFVFIVLYLLRFCLSFIYV